MTVSTKRRNVFLQWLALGIVLLSLSANFGYLLLEDRERTLSDEHERLTNRARIVSENVGSELESIKSVLTHTRDLMTGWKTHPEGRRLATEHLTALSEAMPVVRTLLILDADGGVFASNRKELEGRNFRERDYFLRVARNPSAATLYIGAPFETALGVYGMNVLSMIPQPNGEFGGVVSVTLNPDRFRVLLESVRYKQEVSAGLVHGNGRIFVIQPDVPNLQRVDLARPGTLFSRFRDSGESLALMDGTDAIAGRERIGAFATIRPPALQMDTALIVGILRDKDTLQASWQERAGQQALLILLFAVASIAGTAAYQWRSKQRQIAQDDLVNAKHLSDDIISSLPGIFYMVALDGRLVRWNSRFATVTGYEDAELKGKPALEVISPADRELIAARIRQVFEQGEADAEGGLLGKDGTTIPYRFSGQRITIDGLPYLIGVGDDISENLKAEAALRDSELRFRTLADRSPLAIQVFSPGGATLRVNAAWEQLWQTPFAALKDYNVLEDRQLDELGILPILKRAFAGEQVVFPEHRYDKARATEVVGGEGEIWLRAFAYPVQDENGRLLEVVLIQEDITTRRKLEDQVRQLAFHDPLTRLPNRRLIGDRLSQVMAASKRTNCHGALMFLDLDNFKPLNDRHGHEAGDLLLIAVADRLRSCVREVDTVGRFGGDEFIVILSELNASRDSSVKQAQIVAEKICASLAEPYHLELKREGHAAGVIEHHCSASIGVALFLDHQPGQDAVIKLADAAMYRAKDAGRNQVQFSEEATG